MHNSLYKVFLISLFFLTFTFSCFAQGQTEYKRLVSSIDSLAGLGLPKSALVEINKLDNLARKNNNVPQQIKAVIYRITFLSYLEENALEAIINRLKRDIDQSVYPVKPVLQSLLAEIYWKYYQENRYQFSQRTALNKPDPNFTRWDLKTIIKEVSKQYKLSLNDSVSEQKTPLDILDGVLIGDPETRHLRPTLYDLLAHRALMFFLNEEPDLLSPKMPFSIKNASFFADNREFLNTLLITSDTLSISYQGVKLLQDITRFHLKNKESEALADINLKRLNYVFSKSVHPEKDSLYLTGLKKLAKIFSGNQISADALVQIGLYYKQKDSLKIARYYLAQVNNLFPKSIARENADQLIRQIEKKEIDVTVENVNIPERPVLVLLNYRNVSEVKYQLYKLSEKQLKDILKSDDRGNRWRNERVQPSDALLNYLSKQTALKEASIQVSNPADFRNHTTEFNLDPLRPGNYLLISKDAASNEKSLVNIVEFKITELAYTVRVNPSGDLDFLTLHRETGKPLSNVKVTVKEVQYSSDVRNDIILGTGISEENGKLTLSDINRRGQTYVTLSIPGDTFQDEAIYLYGELAQKSPDKATDRTVFFTDRQIYRPGQTIYFKGLQLIQSRTKSEIVTGQPVTVKFNDANGKESGSLNLVTNESGTFAGSFIVPQNTLNGTFTIYTDDGSIHIQVEEYKRPTFQVDFDPVKGIYRLNDSVSVSGKVMAFSDYGISQAKVAYRIIRGKVDFHHYRYGFLNNQTEIMSDTIRTNNAGEFTIKFKALPEDRTSQNDIVYNYLITADVTDASGETRSSSATVAVADKTYRINFPLPQKLSAIDSLKIPVSLSNFNNQKSDGKIKVNIYSLKSPGKTFINRLWNIPDLPSINKDEFSKLFPHYEYKDENNKNTWPRQALVKKLELNISANKNDFLDLTFFKNQASGNYKFEIFATNAKGDTTSLNTYTYLIAEPSVPTEIQNWVLPVKTTVAPGENAEFIVGSGMPGSILMETYADTQLLSSRWLAVSDKQELIKIPVHKNNSQFSVQFLTVFHNRQLTSYHKITFKKNDEQLNIRFLTFRDKLQPGQKEQWKLQISSKDKQAAEMVASLYDASLDAIVAPQNWLNNFNYNNNYSPNYFAWSQNNFVRQANSTPFGYYQNNDFSLIIRNYETLDLMGYNYFGGYNWSYQNYLRLLRSKAKLAEQNSKLKEEFVSGIVTDNNNQLLVGVTVKIKGTKISTTTDIDGYFEIKAPQNAVFIFSFIGYKSYELKVKKGQAVIVKLKENMNRQKLQEVVVAGFGTQRKVSVIGSVSNAQIPELQKAAGIGRDLSSATEDNDVYNMATIDGTLRDRPKEIAIRRNFNETAFFYPQLRTDSKGEVLIEFTIPEALTRWRFKGFAHSKSLQTGYVEREVVTQKSLMISANMPRFFREGDIISISARTANLTDKAIKGKVELQLFNALTMQPVTLLADQAQASQDFELEGSGNKTVSFQLIIPKGLDAITYRLTADGGEFSDGEENTIPVLPNSMLVTESMPMMVRAGQTKTFTLSKLTDNTSTTLQNKTLTLEYTQNPVWYAVQALPYLMENHYECSEQIFNRYFANSLASTVIMRLPKIKTVFEQWKRLNSDQLLSHLEKNQELKSVLIQETPWLRDAVSETEQKKRIALLFDLNKMKNELELNLDKLSKMQRMDGGFPWFAGSDYSDRYITQHILAGMGQLNKLTGIKESISFQNITKKGLKYLDNEIIEDYKDALKYEKKQKTRQEDLSSIVLHALYARSYYTTHVMSSDLKAAFAYFLPKVSADWKFENVYEQSLMAFVMQRYSQPITAKAIVRSLKETAQQSEELGMYWAKNRVGYHWYQSPIETQALLIELFSEIGNEQSSVDEMKIWLLRNKQTNNWKTTKATALACYSLLLRGDSWVELNSASELTLAGESLLVLKPESKADAGTGYIKTSWKDEQIKPELGNVTIQNSGKAISWGSVHWQYLENLDKISSAETQLKLERKYFIQRHTDAGLELTEVNNSNTPTPGDVLKVVVYLNADRDYEYIHLKDMRPSGTEPSDILSGYKYQERFYYYQVTKDVATNFFINYLPKGKYVFEYSLRVVQPGDFSTGISSIQCLYAPEFNAHSAGSRITIK